MTAQQAITQALLAQPGVTAQPHRFGGVEYRYGRREIGHIHGDRMVDIPFPKKVRVELVAAQKAEPHHLLPETGWISFYIRSAEDVQAAIDLLLYSLELIRSRRATKN